MSAVQDMITDRISAQVKSRPNAVAVTHGDRRVTYGQLDTNINHLAEDLIRRGLGRGDLVGICIDRSIEMVTAVLATLRAGGTYVPLDPAYPDDRLGMMVQDCKLSFLLTGTCGRPQRVSSTAQVVSVSEIGKRPCEPNGPLPPQASGENDLAYVIYTSGSTGKPKGAGVYHRGLNNLVDWYIREFELGDQDDALLITSLSFDLTQKNIFYPLCVGATLHLPPCEQFDPHVVLDALAQHGVTVVNCTPSVFYLLLESDAGHQYRRLSSLRYVFLGGEPISTARLRPWTRCPDCAAQIVNTYGPTECSDVCAWYRLTDQDLTDGAAVPIGQPIDNATLHILDDDHRSLPAGQTGQLHIGGVGVGAGYLNDPDLTAQKFFDNPFDKENNTFLYSTGDLARLRPDGYIDFLGRQDHQVKIRGYRIELGEIESILTDMPQVKACVVTVRQESSGHCQRMICYFVPEPDATLSPADLRAGLTDKLPTYMHPSTYVRLDQLPLTPSGKVDRNALPSPARQRPDLGQAYAAPRDELERFLEKIWCQVLDLEHVGVHDPFFELGGTSLQMAQVVNRLRSELNEMVYVVTLFEAPTISQYASLLRRDYASTLSNRFDRGGDQIRALAQEQLDESHVDSCVTEHDVEQMKRYVPMLSGSSVPTATGDPKNRPALFILSPPRSGTTLLRIMLAGHPALFGGTELNLMGFQTLKERSAAFTGKFSAWLEGTIRAIMEIKKCTVQEAKSMMQAYEDQGFTTRAFYREMQGWLGDLMLVDKSPSYVLDRQCLQKIEEDFDRPLYIHLVRHPYAMIRSFVNYHMDQILYLHPHPHTARILAELVWTLSHQTTLDFLRHVPEERVCRVQFERLVAQPQPVMEALCEQFGMAFDPAVLDPYQDMDRKMVDGIYAESIPMGDTKFFDHQRIRPEVADAWRDVCVDNSLGQVTWRVAQQLGYTSPTTKQTAESISPTAGGLTQATPTGRSVSRQRQLRLARRRQREQR